METRSTPLIVASTWGRANVVKVFLALALQRELTYEVPEGKLLYVGAVTLIILR